MAAGRRPTMSPASMPARRCGARGLGVDPRRRGGRLRWVDSRCQHRDDHASQDVTGPGRGEPFVAAIDDQHRPPGSATRVVGPFNSTVHPRSTATRRTAAKRSDSGDGAGEQGELAVVRGQHGRPRPCRSAGVPVRRRSTPRRRSRRRRRRRAASPRRSVDAPSRSSPPTGRDRGRAPTPRSARGRSST